MDQHLFELALLRATERLIAVLLGGVAIVLGYRLFMNVPQATEGSARVDISGKLKVVLTRIAPGVFFALFGAGIIWASYHYQVDGSNSVYGNYILKYDQTKRDSLISWGKHSSFKSAGNVMAVESDTYQTKLSLVRQHVRQLNKLTTTLPAQQLASVDATIIQSKLALLGTVWQPAWGSYDDFVAWIDQYGEVMPTNKQLKEPYALYTINEP